MTVYSSKTVQLDSPGFVSDTTKTPRADFQNVETNLPIIK